MNETVSAHIEAPDPASMPADNEPPLVFFGIGMVINVVLVIAYLVWACRQWKKTDRHEN